MEADEGRLLRRCEPPSVKVGSTLPKLEQKADFLGAHIQKKVYLGE